MSSEPSIATIKSASMPGVNGDPPRPNDNLHNVMHSSPQGDAEPVASNESLGSPDDILDFKTPKPDFDPFERLLKPLLEQDTIQCNAWKDEVQNILIFAGLFSAVTTAFIIESYQRLQPDPNDTIVDLLAHIAERLDNTSINGTVPVLSIVSNANFSPSRPDININVFWFISLVLSLTAALIGIITLQWLREHQRYDSTLQAQQRMAILNARLDSLQQWYVPEIFAGLPLLLQGALVLFFAGMIQFLFALCLKVAIPVTLSICIPLIFLTATTLLPILQIYILQYPFRLSINDNVPSPCPYKSPQSLIFRRIGTHSQTVFKFVASIVVGAYVCTIEITCFIQKLARSQPPVFRSQWPHLQVSQHDRHHQEIQAICDAPSAHWSSIDVSWLSSRSIHAISLQQAKSCQEDNFGTPWTINNMAGFPPEVYDCIRCLHGIQDGTRADHLALYCCAEALFSHAVDKFRNRFASLPPPPPDILESESTDLCFALGQLLNHVYPSDSIHYEANPWITAAFIEDVILRKSQDQSQITVKTLASDAEHGSRWGFFAINDTL
ncbi:hypothetical protein D9619_009812 [Psilocybe cf. subviscida]|uniref:DUF6535 domain-containing protein n=1 Tax=Psilocybe cf. subviscida TaxID=2480587 RepID=A0A8H5BKF4_9AGAR|nr:hypothetical protein D9619_009812 [Psilocybe cf. subviscida]